MKEKVEAVVFPIGDDNTEEKPSHVDSKQRHGKRYKQQSVFTIEENSDDEYASGAAVDENKKEEVINSSILLFAKKIIRYYSPKNSQKHLNVRKCFVKVA